ncbi:MAG TPA: UrcA family protein [Steroidobacteraceae bacterium]|nr:UrcA family protein [Steroidobacteraceae bacterium]
MTSATLRTGARMRTATAFALIAACVAVSAAGSAHAAAVADVPAIKVRYADLNLATEQGSLALYDRIVAAAQQVCAPEDIRDLQAVAAARSCRQQAIALAVRDVHSPMLASLYAAEQRHG